MTGHEIVWFDATRRPLQLNQMKKVSILIPCYNAEKWLTETLDCCLRQTYPNIEVILVDDGSTDNSLSIAREYEQKDSRIHVFTQPNSGGCRARNVAFEKSTGDYIKYLDADDLMSDNMIEVQMNRLEEEGDPRAVATCPYDDFWGDNYNVPMLQRRIYQDFESGLDYYEFCSDINDFFVVSCWLTHRSIIVEAGMWNETLTKIQDGEFFCRVCSICSHLFFCGNCRFFYRHGHLSVSSKNKLSEEKVRSSLEGRIMCENTIRPLRDNQKIRYGFAMGYSRVMLNSVYGSKLYLQARNRCLGLGIKPFHPSPKPMVKVLEFMIGFENILKLKSIIKG